VLKKLWKTEYRGKHSHELSEAVARQSAKPPTESSSLKAFGATVAHLVAKPRNVRAEGVGAPPWGGEAPLCGGEYKLRAAALTTFEARRLHKTAVLYRRWLVIASPHTFRRKARGRGDYTKRPFCERSG